MMMVMRNLRSQRKNFMQSPTQKNELYGRGVIFFSGVTANKSPLLQKITSNLYLGKEF